MPTPPDPPPTPPRGGAHLHVDAASLAERAADKAHDAKKIAMHAGDRSAEALSLSRRHAEMIERLPAIETKLDLALRPTLITGGMRAAMYAAAAALVVLAGLAVTVTFVRQSSPMQGSSAQVISRVQVP